MSNIQSIKGGVSAMGLQLKRLRIEAGLSQQTVATQCDIFRTYLSRIESGKANPTASVLVSLARALHVTVGELFPEGV